MSPSSYKIEYTPPWSKGPLEVRRTNETNLHIFSGDTHIATVHPIANAPLFAVAPDFADLAWGQLVCLAFGYHVEEATMMPISEIQVLKSEWSVLQNSIQAKLLTRAQVLTITPICDLEK